MKWIFSFCALTLVACGSNSRHISTQDEKLSELRYHFEQRLRTIAPADKLDSFKLISIDTLSRRDKYSYLKDTFIDSLNRTKLRMELVTELYNANIRLMNLAKGKPGQDYDIFKTEAEENKTELEKFEQESKQLESQSLYYDSLLNITDTKTPIGLKAVCLYQLRRKDRSVLIDTANILMNLDKNIIRKEDFITLP